MKFEHEKFGKAEMADLTQKQLEEFHRAMKGKGEEPLSVWRGESVRAAANLKIMVDPDWTAEDVDNAKPAHVVWLSDCIVELIQEAMNLDPLS